MGRRPHRPGVSRVRLCKAPGARLGCGGSGRVCAVLGSSGLSARSSAAEIGYVKLRIVPAGEFCGVQQSGLSAR